MSVFKLLRMIVIIVVIMVISVALTEPFLCLQETYTLEHTCGGVSASHPSDRMLNLLTNFVLPLCIRVGCGCRGEIIPLGEVSEIGVGYMIERFIYMELQSEGFLGCLGDGFIFRNFEVKGF